MKPEDTNRNYGYAPKVTAAGIEQLREFAMSFAADYPLALTLTLKQTIVEETPKGTVLRAITRHDCERIANRFRMKLNRVVFGKTAAEKHGKSLKYFTVVEGGRNCKQLHLHFALGGLPDFVSPHEMDALVTLAKKQVLHVNKEHQISLADSGWLKYIVKEATKSDSDSVIWTLH